MEYEDGNYHILFSVCHIVFFSSLVFPFFRFMFTHDFFSKRVGGKPSWNNDFMR
jgi:hypothetical protein